MKKLLHAGLMCASVAFCWQAKAFDKVYTFGDSLSDGGFAGNFTRFISGYDSKLYSEIISETYTHQPLLPYTQSGTNFAQSGSTASNTPLLIYKTEKKINDYLSTTSGRADKDGLYILWIGGNDISVDVESGLLGLKFDKIFNQGENYLLSDAPSDVVRQTQMLLDAGAGTVVVPNLPNAGVSPWTATALFGFAQMFLGGSLLDLPSLYAIQDNYLRNIGDIQGEEARQKAVIDSMSTVLASQGIHLPEEMTSAILGSFVQMENTLTEQFNNDVNSGLNQLNGNIVYADVNRLFKEIIDSPKTYGFDNILTPICRIGIGAPFCNEDTDGFYDDKNYLFSDWFHPSPTTHALIARYIMSIIDAPLIMQGLQHRILSQQSERRLSLNTHFQSARSEGMGEKVSVFGGYSGKYTKFSTEPFPTTGRGISGNALLGVSLQPVEGLLFGGNLSRGYSRFKSGPMLTYGYGSTLVGLFGQIKAASGLWANLDLSYGRGRFTDITRKIPLGTVLRNETASTGVRSGGGMINGGYDFKASEFLTTGPTLGFSYDLSTIKGYQENSNNSTAMRFSSRKLKQRQITGGWRLESHGLAVNPYLELGYRQENVTGSEVKASLKTTRTSFTRGNSKSSEKFIEGQLGMNASLTKNLRVNAVTRYSNGIHSNNSLSYGMGLNYAF